MWTVYELYDLYGNILYVGETINIKDRFYKHTKCKRVSPGTGKFKGQLIFFYEVAYFNNRKDARSLEEELKIQYGFPITERTTIKKSNAVRKNMLKMLEARKHNEIWRQKSSANGTKQCTIIHICPRCKKTGKGPKFQNHIEKGIKSCKK
jgi:predicted GIY-YIG superfamily endonuclease